MEISERKSGREGLDALLVMDGKILRVDLAEFHNPSQYTDLRLVECGFLMRI
jgi:hypothetical protein